MGAKWDKELQEFSNRIGRDKFKKMYNTLYNHSRKSKNVRFSGEKYENKKEKLQDIKEKYKNGVSDSEIKNWFFQL